MKDLNFSSAIRFSSAIIVACIVFADASIPFGMFSFIVFAIRCSSVIRD
ncbi:hypothetical protein [Borrelia puertoricensis]|nr:hypothetical protein [Borrelia puertoricensis]